MAWPAFMPNQIIVGNPNSNVAVLCGWTKREFTQRQMVAIDPEIMTKVGGEV